MKNGQHKLEVKHRTNWLIVKLFKNINFAQKVGFSPLFSQMNLKKFGRNVCVKMSNFFSFTNIKSGQISPSPKSPSLIIISAKSPFASYGRQTSWSTFNRARKPSAKVPAVICDFWGVFRISGFLSRMTPYDQTPTFHQSILPTFWKMSASDILVFSFTNDTAINPDFSPINSTNILKDVRLGHFLFFLSYNDLK